MDRKIRLLQALRLESAECARYCKARGDIDGFHKAMNRVNAYASAFYILTDEDYFESMCQIWDIK